MINAIDFPLSLGFEDIAIQQNKNICKSRLDVDLKSEVIKGLQLKIPMIAANMSTVTNSDFCIKLHELGALGVLHRAMSEKVILKEIKKISQKCQWVAGSIGIGEEQLSLAKNMILEGCNVIVIDIAHGFSDEVINLGRKIKNYNKEIKIVLGNTVNIGLLEESADFADAIKVGIGQGDVCETKNTAGCTEKQFSAVLKFKELSKKYGIPIISDGSIKEPADFIKAISAGANSIMAGKIFAACPESAAETVSVNDQDKKIYAGMSSRYVQNKWKGGLKEGTCSEGTVKYLDIGESVDKLIERYSGALRSGITYGGAKDITEFQNKVSFVRFK